MRNLWLFILRNNAFFLFIIFEAAALALLVRNNRYQQTSLLNSANRVAGTVYSKADQVGKYLLLARVNDSLAAENARLRRMFPADTPSVTGIPGPVDTAGMSPVDPAAPDPATAPGTAVDGQYRYIAAKVVNNTVIYRNNFLTLNRGEKDGVRSGMGVIGPNGVVGIIKDVSGHFSTAYSILHKDVRVSVKLDSSDNIGSLVWPGSDPRYAAMEDVPTHVRVNKNEKVVTTGFSLFPEATPVGTVTDVKKGGPNSFLDITVALSTHFQQLQYVYIVVNKFRDEQEQLEQNLEK